MKKNLLFLIILFVCSCNGRYSIATQDDLRYFSMVDEALNNKEIYLEQFNNRVSEVRQRLANSKDRESIYIYQRLLAEQYMGYEADTALSFIDKNIEKAEELGKTDWLAESYIQKSQTFNTAGLIEKSREILDKVKLLPMGQEIKLKYLMEELSYWRYHVIQYNLPSPDTRVIAYADSIVQLMPNPASPYYNFAKTYQITNSADMQAWQTQIMHYADSLDENNPWYKYITECASFSAWRNQDISNQLKYGALSIVTKIKQVDRHVPYMALLGTMATEMGELSYAARFYNATINIQADHPEYVFNGRATLSRAIMEFHDAVEKRLNLQNQQNRTLNYLILFFTILVIILLVATLIELRKVRSLHKKLKLINEELSISEINLRHSNEQLLAKEKMLTTTNTELTEANFVKEEYIGQLFATCSTYLDKMNMLKKNIHRKLKAGQYADAIKQTQVINQKDNEDLRELWDEFDNVFLRLFPDFLKQFNELLRPEEQITLKTNGQLNTDLRIYALIRLGIDSSVKISKMLGMSVQTVYNARTKMRGKANFSEEDFDLRVRKLKPTFTSL
ncbi:MAG: DUF6377 domain-containing protein [Bacteroidaceae bacterium]|nr:DUF6377 domain-containing protein [Bacteroidaceae bacterium]